MIIWLVFRYQLETPSAEKMALYHQFAVVARFEYTAEKTTKQVPEIESCCASSEKLMYIIGRWFRWPLVRSINSPVSARFSSHVTRCAGQPHTVYYGALEITFFQLVKPLQQSRDKKSCIVNQGSRIINNLETPCWSLGGLSISADPMRLSGGYSRCHPPPRNLILKDSWMLILKTLNPIPEVICCDRWHAWVSFLVFKILIYMWNVIHLPYLTDMNQITAMAAIPSSTNLIELRW